MLVISRLSVGEILVSPQIPSQSGISDDPDLAANPVIFFLGIGHFAFKLSLVEVFMNFRILPHHWVSDLGTVSIGL